jgi:hypothetical protein
MVTILEDYSPQTQRMQAFSKLAGNIGQGVQTLTGALEEKKIREALAEEFGKQFKNIRNPEFQKMILQSELNKREQAAKLAASSKSEQENYEKIKKSFGEQFADVWLASPTGARTALETAAIQQGLRKLPVGGLFGEEPTEGATGEEIESAKINTVNLPWGESFTFPKVEGPKNLTPQGLETYKKDTRKANSPIYQENTKKGRALKDTEQHLNILEDLNPKIPEGAARLLIDKEGNIRPTALRFKAVPPSMERFVKTVNDFLSSAKDTFGARVTNFDIQQFKSRLPGLLNSREGRRQIIEQMKIFNEIESNYRNALKKVYNHYGLDGITEEKAESLVENMVADREEFLRARLLAIGEMENMQERPSLEEIFG